MAGGQFAVSPESLVPMPATAADPLSNLWPLTTSRNDEDVLAIDGIPLTKIAAAVGTPVYIYDVSTLRAAAAMFRETFARFYPKSRVVFAGKAFLGTALIPILREAGLGLDVVSGGELYAGLQGGMPAADISMHGNNKGREELQEAIAAGIGKIVIDNDHEIDLLIDLTRDLPEPLPVMLRLNPGVDVHTHRKISTGLVDSKFGLPIRTGQAAAAVSRIAGVSSLKLLGYHAHVGSQLFDANALLDAIDELLGFAAEMRQQHGVELAHLSPGGGFGIAYQPGDRPLDIGTWMQVLSEAIIAGCRQRHLDLPVVTIEPGRAIAGPAGIALYTVGARKELPGIRTYVSVDGGMADNIRPSLYDAVYTAELVTSARMRGRETVTIAGKFCESGDVLIEDIDLPVLESGDVLAIPAAGAYCYAMASNYNLARRPPVVFIEDGVVTLVRRRETYDDLLGLDVTNVQPLSL
jgi:diaminopimelate decarboxylase